MLYDDDSLIFCDADEEQIRLLRMILSIFEAISGLHVNWRKSQIYSVNEVPNIQRLAGVLGCEVGVLPTAYLGLPLGGKNKFGVECWRGVKRSF